MIRSGVVALLTAALACTACSSRRGDTVPSFSRPSPSRPGLAVGDRVPDLAMTSLDGRRVRMSALRGHPVLVNFWASWCIPCRKEFTVIADAAARHGELRVVGVTFQDSVPAAKRFEREHRSTWPSVVDPRGRIAARYGVGIPPGIPQSFFIDAQGRVRAHVFGELSEALMAENLQKVGIDQT